MAIDKAIKTYEELLEKFPEQTSMFAPALAHLHAQINQFDKSMQVMEQSQPAEDEDTKTTTAFYLSWINIIITTENWSKLSKIISKFKKQLKHVSETDDVKELQDELMEQYMYFHKAALFQEAEIYIGLADAIARNNNDIKKHIMKPKNKHVCKKKSADCLVICMLMHCFTTEHMNGSTPAKYLPQK